MMELNAENAKRFAGMTIDDSGCIMSRQEACDSLSQIRARGDHDIVRRAEPAQSQSAE